MADAWRIKYSNLSSHDVQITDFGGVTEAVVGEVNHKPSGTLAAGASDYLGMDQNALKFIANGALDFYQGLSWGGMTLWVRIHVPLQILGIGTRPYYYIHTDSGQDPGLDGSWQGGTSTDNSSVEIANGDEGLKITISPTGTHTTLTVAVTIEDK